MNSSFERIEPISKKTRVVKLLREAILSGTFKGGDPIVEAKMAQEFGVGQGLIREVLIELEHDGFVDRTPFTGTTVRTLTVQDAQQIFEVRIELEPLAFYLAAKAAQPGDIAILSEMIGQTKIDAKSGILEAFFESHLNFRKKVWELSGNRYLQQALGRIVIPLYALYLIHSSHNQKEIFQTVVQCMDHQDKILKAFQNDDPDAARKVARDFLIRMKEYLGTTLVPDRR